MAKRRDHGEGSIYQRASDGMWVAQLELTRSGDGRRRRKSFTAKTRREVVEKLKRAQRDLDKGRDLTADRLTVGEFLDRWISTEVQPSDLAQATQVSYEGNVRLHLKPTIGHVRIDRLDALAVQAVFERMRERGLSSRSQQLAHATLRVALQHALQLGIIDRNVAQFVRAPRPRRDPDRVQPIALADVTRLLDHTQGDQMHSYWLLLATTGLRKGESLALRWSDVDFEAGTLRVERSLYRLQGVGLRFKENKTQNSTRTVPLPEVTVAALRTLRAQQAERRLSAGEMWEDNDLLFCTDTGRPLDLKAPNTALRSALRELGLGEQRVHNFRHMFATIGGVAAGGDLHVLSRHLGHTSITTTANMYRHMISSSQRNLADGVADALLAFEQ